MNFMTSRDLNQKTSEAKKLARKSPLFITNRGDIDFVLLSYEEYKRINGRGKSLADLLSMPADDDIEFDPPKLANIGLKPAEFD